jgi:hypothetical protein
MFDLHFVGLTGALRLRRTSTSLIYRYMVDEPECMGYSEIHEWCKADYMLQWDFAAQALSSGQTRHALFVTNVIWPLNGSWGDDEAEKQQKGIWGLGVWTTPANECLIREITFGYNCSFCPIENQVAHFQRMPEWGEWEWGMEEFVSVPKSELHDFAPRHRSRIAEVGLLQSAIVNWEKR